jgi:hypothetical protein
LNKNSMHVNKFPLIKAMKFDFGLTARFCLSVLVFH